MAEEQTPFADVVVMQDGFSIPELKWRELLFVGALRPDGDCFRRDPARPLPAFRPPGLFPDEARFRAERVGDRVLLRPV